MNIGEEEHKEVIRIEPIPEPVQVPDPEPVQVPEPVKVPEKVPADV